MGSCFPILIDLSVRQENNNVIRHIITPLIQMEKHILKLLAHILRGIHEKCGQHLQELSSISTVYYFTDSSQGWDLVMVGIWMSTD